VPFYGLRGGTTRHPALKAFCDRLRASGKKTKVALVACMRKLLTQVNDGPRSDTLERRYGLISSLLRLRFNTVAFFGAAKKVSAAPHRGQ
jgi:transposase